MKLRIQDNSLRLRLTRNEVAHLDNRGSVEAAIRFSADRALSYCVTSSADANGVSVRYDGDSICVILPEKTAREWAQNDEITIAAFDSGVQILVEKDFQCLHQAAASDPEAYPHPMA